MKYFKVNHLLNFQSYENAPDAQSRDQNKRRTRTKSQRYRGSHGKEDYVQATGQFIVHESAALEFEPFLQNPNIHVPWKYIEAIRLYSQEKTNVSHIQPNNREISEFLVPNMYVTPYSRQSWSLWTRSL